MRERENSKNRVSEWEREREREREREKERETMRKGHNSILWQGGNSPFVVFDEHNEPTYLASWWWYIEKYKSKNINGKIKKL